MRSLVFEGNTWEAYEAMRESDKNLLKSLRKLLKEMLRSDDPCKGTGKPEPLKHNLSGLWLRRISQKNRVVYKFDDTYIYIFALGGALLSALKPRSAEPVERERNRLRLEQFVRLI